MKITMFELKRIIKECACDMAKDMGFDGPEHSIKVIKLDEPTIKSGLFPKMDDERDDDQGEKSMILGNLERLSNRSAALRDMAADIPDNEEWVQEKIAVASSMIDSIYDYLRYKDKE
jgi:hypothetical protein